jgi:hypothetical protein
MKKYQRRITKRAHYLGLYALANMAASGCLENF